MNSAPVPSPAASFWRPSALFALGRGIALALLAVALAIYAADPSLLWEARHRGFDLAQRLWPLHPGSKRVQIVAIDEQALKRYGQWPWPRAEVAELVRRIAAGKPQVLGVDILFPEADRLSPPLLARSLHDLPAPMVEALGRLPSSDTQLGEAFGEVPTVFGAAPTNEGVPARKPHRAAPISEHGSDPRPYLKSYPALIRSVSEVMQHARSEAALTNEPDEDGMVRSVPLLTDAAGQLLPALALEVIRVAAGMPSISVTTGGHGIESVTLGDATIPTDPRGRVYLHFGPPEERYISAATVLDPAFDPSLFENQVVLLGVTGLGILDQQLTPLGPVPGIDVHAQLIDSILGLAGPLLQRPPQAVWIEVAALLLAGLAIIWLLRYESPRLAAAAAFAIILVLVAGEFALFRFAGWLVDGMYPATVALLIFGVMLSGHLRATQNARRRLAQELEHERQVTARLEGELTAARAIQMGLLPHRFPPFPERQDIDLYARIEPARAVGGDLFDFLLIDGSRLFFIIADVSGKGIPAALFMAMTKEVVRDAVQRHGDALDRILAEANAKTAAAAAEMDMMFVTAFAGILDLDSGELHYASAGHDRPFLLYDERGLRQLETEGGPPLGVVDGYMFPIERDRLRGGAILLLYTDGVTEAQDESGGFYTASRLSDLLAAARGESAQAIVDACFEAVQRFAGNAEQADDITVLAIRRDVPAVGQPEAGVRAVAAPVSGS
ncbi:MAG: CHASE2 domain-containing protein [Thiohalocapsa sp.]